MSRAAADPIAWNMDLLGCAVLVQLSGHNSRDLVQAAAVPASWAAVCFLSTKLDWHFLGAELLVHDMQEFKGASHALLQEADIDLAQLMKQLGFYVSQRHMSAPVKKRGKSTFGSAAPIEKPTLGELDYYSEG